MLSSWMLIFVRDSSRVGTMSDPVSILIYSPKHDEYIKRRDRVTEYFTFGSEPAIVEYLLSLEFAAEPHPYRVTFYSSMCVPIILDSKGITQFKLIDAYPVADVISDKNLIVRT